MTLGTAPGKIILFGEHAVVYGRPALAAPVTQVQAQVDVSDSPHAGIRIEAPDIDVHAEMGDFHPRTGSRNRRHAPGPDYFHLFLQPGDRGGHPHASTIPVARDGSGRGFRALIRALSAHLGSPLTDEQVSAIAYEVEKIHHGRPSGIDNTVVTYAQPVYFVRGLPAETFSVRTPFTLVIGDTGLPAPTRESVGDVRRLWDADQARWEKVFDEIGQIAQEARHRIESGAWMDLGDLMDTNHALLQELTVSNQELERLVLAARRAGALGAKLSGGGRGGNMIALVAPEVAGKVAATLKDAGAVRTIVTTVR
jgi:mevalonate kinase